VRDDELPRGGPQLRVRVDALLDDVGAAHHAVVSRPAPDALQEMRKLFRIAVARERSDGGSQRSSRI
jgi:hypothetical protein